MSTASSEPPPPPEDVTPTPDSPSVETIVEPSSETPIATPPTETVVAEAVSDESPFSNFQQLSPRAIEAEHFSLHIFISIVFVAGLIAFSVCAFAVPFRGMLVVYFLTFLVLLAILYTVLYRLPIRAHRHAFWRWNSQGLDIRRGIWFRKEISVPRGRVQHTDVHQGPLMRKFHIAKLLVHTAGTREYVVELNGLDYGVACQLRDLLISDQVVRDGVN